MLQGVQQDQHGHNSQTCQQLVYACRRTLKHAFCPGLSKASCEYDFLVWEHRRQPHVVQKYGVEACWTLVNIINPALSAAQPTHA